MDLFKSAKRLRRKESPPTEDEKKQKSDHCAAQMNRRETDFSKGKTKGFQRGKLHNKRQNKRIRHGVHFKIHPKPPRIPGHIFLVFSCFQEKAKAEQEKQRCHVSS